VKKAGAFAWIILAVGILYILSGLRAPRPQTEMDSQAFAKLPVQVGGRVKPFDTLARTSLLVLRGKQTYVDEQKNRMEASDWLLEVILRPDRADHDKVFLIHDPDVLGLFGWKQEKEKYFSFHQLQPHLEEIERQARLAEGVESQLRSRFQGDILKLYQRLILYYRLKNSVHTEDCADFHEEMALYANILEPGREALRKQQAGEKDFDTKALQLLGSFAKRFDFLAQTGYFSPIPPDDAIAAAAAEGDWKNVGEELIDHGRAKAPLHPIAHQFGLMDAAYRKLDSKAFANSLAEYQAYLAAHIPELVKKAEFEYFFNHFEPFYRCMVLYVGVFILSLFGWLRLSEGTRKAASWLLVLTIAVHTFGLFARMYLQGRPPVTNLYSSAIFIGWAAVLLGMFLEWIYRNGVGNVTASIIGFLTLIIAHHLGGDGDTLEMMRAVLDSNFWLATHVVVITLGYSAAFLAGALAIIYILRGAFTRSMTRPEAKSLYSMVYGTICFTALFSFVGTVLGGIWADQSWGRFWGWDAKENGALMIVLWNAIILHARWGGYIRERGMMVMAVFGNIVTSFSWFGVNMLGVGLHSYGFMDKSFPWLLGFDVSQLLIMLAGAFLPLHIIESKSGGNGTKNSSVTEKPTGLAV
jgi:ABC-type transport system involved in cytochrome c biogenesis permease subunit